MEFLAKKLSVRLELQAAQKEMRGKGYELGFFGWWTERLDIFFVAC